MNPIDALNLSPLAQEFNQKLHASNAAKQLTKRQLDALTVMRDLTISGEYEDAELVKEGRVVMIGLARFGLRTFYALLRTMAISQEGDPDRTFERWHINETGRMILTAAGR